MWVTISLHLANLMMHFAKHLVNFGRFVFNCYMWRCWNTSRINKIISTIMMLWTACSSW